jgi:hypothetical protein
MNGFVHIKGQKSPFKIFCAVKDSNDYVIASTNTVSPYKGPSLPTFKVSKKLEN